MKTSQIPNPKQSKKTSTVLKELETLRIQERNRKYVNFSVGVKGRKYPQETIPIRKGAIRTDTKTYSVDHYWDPFVSNESPRNVPTRWWEKKDLNPPHRPIQNDRSFWGPTLDDSSTRRHIRDDNGD